MEKLEEEIWRKVSGFEGFYEVSSEGKVRSLNYKGVNGRIGEMAPGNVGGYLQVGLSKDGEVFHKLIHRLVAGAFLPNPDNLQQVNHLDEDTLNNHVSNLEWATPRKNANHGTRNTRISKSLFNGKRSKPVEAVDLITGEVRLRFKSMAEAARRGFNQGSISKCCKGTQSSHRGFIWRYINY